MRSEILAIIPARGGSKAIPLKNLAMLGGKPLLQYTIDAAKQSKLITRIILSSDHKEIIRYAHQQGIEVPFVRPAELARDTTPMIEVVEHAVKYLVNKESYRPDYIVLLQPTSPLRTAQHIDEALMLLLDSEADSVVSVVDVPHQFNPYSVMLQQGNFLVPFLEFDETRNLRQLKPRFYARNGPAVCALTYECLIQKKSLYGEKILPYVMDRAESIDIDDSWDLSIAEYLLKIREGAIGRQ